jgi:hypothetical protein
MREKPQRVVLGQSIRCQKWHFMDKKKVTAPKKTSVLVFFQKKRRLREIPTRNLSHPIGKNGSLLLLSTFFFHVFCNDIFASPAQCDAYSNCKADSKTPG